MRSRVTLAPVLALLLCSSVVGCGEKPEITYGNRMIEVNDRWQQLRDNWCADPGDADAATEFVSLYAEVRAIRPPESLAEEHKLYLKAMEAERKALEAYAAGAFEQYEKLDQLALDGAVRYWDYMKEAGVTK